MTASPVFLDSSGVVALLSESDWLHQSASRCFLDIGTAGRSLVTTDWILAEAGNSLARGALRPAFARFAGALLAQRRSTVVFVDAALLLEALSDYVAVADKTWGLVDCVSYRIMRRESIHDAFTADRHFEQAGFNCLLRSTR
jgi:predicted nucleic acid-binding protein